MLMLIKKLFPLSLFVLASYVSFPTNAKSLEFCYVSYGKNIDRDLLIAKTREIYEASINSGNALILYLPKGGASMIVQVNTPYDNRNDFTLFLRTLEYSKINASIDVKNIIREFSGIPNLGDYSELSFDFYVPNQDAYRSLVAPLYWSLDLKDFSDNLLMTVYSGSPIDKTNKEYRGVYNLDGMDKDVRVKQFK